MADKKTTPKTPKTGKAAPESTRPDTTPPAAKPAENAPAKASRTDDPAKKTAPKAASVKPSDAKASQTPPKSDTSSDTAKPGPADSAKPATAKADTAKVDTAKSGTPGTDAPTSDSTPKTDAAADAAKDKKTDATPSHDHAQPPHEPGRELIPTETRIIERKGGFWPMLLGGVAAGAIGIFAAQYVLPELGLLPASGDTDFRVEVDQRLDAQADGLADLTAQIAARPADGDLGPLKAAQDDLSSQITAMSQQLASLDQRLTTLENRPATPGDGSAPSAAMESELQSLKQALSDQNARLTALTDAADAQEQAARDSAAATLRRAALTRIRTALDTGAGFAPALADFTATGQQAPDALSAVAETGVPTLATLQSSFPPAARAALQIARAETPAQDGTGQPAGFWTFLSDQLGARSLEPREGDDPDAILSRAEAALRDARLADALTELNTLPEGARAAFSDWVAQASLRMQALAAAESLGAELN